ncbi:MAG: phosphoenolpyruvate carboxykinase (GTP) [Clostridia bacterium]|nr:phosphoenolpyruvate carboxykinase (GTP) [Clostridia bacterium]
MLRNEYVRSWVKEMSEWLTPEDIVWIDGSKTQAELLFNIACGIGELTKLNQELMPGCYLHRSEKSDVARVENRTFICSKEKINAGVTNNWWEPSEAAHKLKSIAAGSYKGRIMYVIPFCMGHIDSDFRKFGVQITDSIYVALSMLTMTRVGKKVSIAFNKLENNWTKCVHCSCSCDPENRYICHFPESNAVISVNSAYGGNAILGKKCLALRLGSYMGKQEGWLAEHMAIFGIKTPYNNEIKYICAALPSGCGKTDLAMLKPGEKFSKAGYEIYCVGDDIAWLKIREDGRLWAINPENGVFGACSGINKKTNPNALKTGSKNTIFTNVVLNKNNQTVWWENLDNNPPEDAIDWLGNDWNINLGTPGAHPNSRFAAPLENCPCLSSEANNPMGVPISAIILGVKRAKLTPLVFESRDWDHGVFIGSIMSSETTVAADGKTGVLRHDPFGMLPFCGYNMSDYFQHWIDIGKKLGENAPKIFGVNWFRTDDKNKYIWPGFEENIRVLDWIVKRLDNKLETQNSPIGLLPKIEDIDTSNLDISHDNLKKILEINPELWESEIKNIKEFYSKFDKNLPEELVNRINN